MTIRLSGGKVFLEGTFQVADLVVEDSGLLKVLTPNQPSPAEVEVVDINGKYVLPGLADIHVHLREPGFEYKETIVTGTAAAARGGFTALGAMPNVSPPPDNIDALEEQIENYSEDAFVNVYPYACLTRGGDGRGELLDYQALEPYVIGFSDDGFGVQDEATLRQAMVAIHEVGGIVAQHAEDLELSADGYINAGDYAKAHGHPGKPGESEWRQLERDLRLVRETGCDYHACHVSTRRSVELLREAKAEGLPVSAETAPHYLALDDEMLKDEGRFRMNPPLRSPDDREAVREALIDGTIDMIATDHAPHSESEKSGGLADSANGVVGLESSLAVVYTEMVHSGQMSMERLVEVMCTNPRERFRIGGGQLVTGTWADLIVFDPEVHEPLDPSQFLSLGKATPFAGIDLYGRVDLTLCEGELIWDPTGLAEGLDA